MVSAICQTSPAQVQTYEDSRGNTHLCGPFPLETLETDPNYSPWFLEGVENWNPELTSTLWAQNLKETQVDIYLGTWCGDSKRWVPRFVTTWEKLGLSRDQLNFIALYNGDSLYKQGPNGEHLGKKIHRIPTFIFKQQGEEVARIVESPHNDLVTDLAQIAYGVPSAPNYRAVSYLQEVLDSNTKEDIYANYREYMNTAYRKAGGSRELNTLGYVYLRAGEIEKALLVFEMNTYLFRFEPNVFESYGEALAIAGKNTEAIAQYTKVLELDPTNEIAQEQLASLED